MLMGVLPSPFVSSLLLPRVSVAIGSNDVCVLGSDVGVQFGEDVAAPGAPEYWTGKDDLGNPRAAVSTLEFSGFAFVNFGLCGDARSIVSVTYDHESGDGLTVGGRSLFTGVDYPVPSP